MSQGQAYKNKVKPETIIWLEENFPAFFTLLSEIVGIKGDITNIKSDISILEGDVSGIENDISNLKEQIDKLAGLTPGSDSITANWQSGTGTSGEAGADLVTIGATDIRYKLHSLLINVGLLTPGATVTVKLFMAINGTERKVYEQAFTRGADPDGLWIVNGTLAIHETLRVEIASDNAGDNGRQIDYDYMLEAM